MKKVREGYKMTELGEIPSEWETKFIGEVTDILTGGTPDTKNSLYWKNGTIPWMPSGDIKNGIIRSVSRRITLEGIKNSAAKKIPKSSVMVALNGQGKTKGTVGLLEIDTTCNQSLAGILPSKYFDSKFMYYQLQSRYLEIRNLAGSDARNGLNLGLIKNIRIVLPQLEEQRKIGQILYTVDEHIEETEKLIEKTKELKKGLMQRLLTKGIGHTRFKKTEVGEIPVEWEVKSLGELTEIIMGQSPNSDSYNQEGEGMPLFQGKTEFGDITPKVQRWCTSPIKVSEPYDILISVRAPVGDVNINNIEACIGRGLAAIRQSNELFYLYIFYFLQYNRSLLNKYSQGSTFTAINNSDLFSYSIPVPSMSEQKHISEIIYNTELIIQNAQQKQIKLQKLKQSLMQKLLTGKVRVKF